MYFFNYKALIEKHRSNQFQSSDVFGYLVGFFALFQLWKSVILFWPHVSVVPEITFLNVADEVIQLCTGAVIFLFILKRWFQAYGKPRPGFLDSIISLGWVFTVRSLIVAVPAFGLFVTLFVYEVIRFDSDKFSLSSMIPLAFVFIGPSVYIYFRVQSSLKAITSDTF